MQSQDSEHKMRTVRRQTEVGVDVDGKQFVCTTKWFLCGIYDRYKSIDFNLVPLKDQLVQDMAPT